MKIDIKNEIETHRYASGQKLSEGLTGFVERPLDKLFISCHNVWQKTETG